MFTQNSRSLSLSFFLLGLGAPVCALKSIPHISRSLFPAVSLRMHLYLNWDTHTERKVGQSAGIPVQWLVQPRLYTEE